MIFEYPMRDFPFIRRYYWYRGKTNYQPRREFLEYNWDWKGVTIPSIKLPFKPIDVKEFVSIQPMNFYPT